MVLRNVPKTDTFEQQRQELNALALDVFNLKQQVDTFNLDDLVDVTAAGATNSQIIKYNGTEWVLDTDVVSTSFTVINASPGSNSNLAYNNTNGTFTYTPPDLSLYRLNTATLNDIPGVNISNPVNTHVLQYDGSNWTNQPFSGVQSLNDIGNVFINNVQNNEVLKWDSTNNRWTNAADTGGTQINTINDIGNVSDTNTQNGQLLKYNSGAGRWENFTPTYISSFTETDPIFSASAAAGITNTLINNWNTAHGWGNHAAQGYLLPVLTNVQTDEILRWNGSNWVNEPTTQHLAQFKPDWAEQDSSKPSFILNKPTLATVATTGSFTDLTQRTLANLTDVTTSGVQNGYILKYNGTSWESAAAITDIQDLGNVVITSPQNGQVLKYNGTNWVNDADLTGGGGGGSTTTIITPVAYAVVGTQSAGTGIGMSWGAYNTSNYQMVFTFDTAQPDANYYVHTNREQYATHNVEILSKSTTGFTTKWTNSDGSDLAPDIFQAVLIVYPSTPTKTVGGGGGSTSVTVSDTAPSNPSSGDLWYKSDEAQLKIWYDDGVGSPSAQWVDTSNNAGGGGGGSSSSGANVSVSDNPPVNPAPQNGDLWWKSNEGRLKIRYEDGDTNQWVDAFPVLDAPTYGYSISAEQGTGSSSKFRLTGTGDVAGIDEITFAGADGITVERTDDSTLTFRQGAGGGGTYTDNDAKDAASAMILGGTHQNISFTYDSANRTLSAIAQASGGGGGTTYDLTGSNNTTNQALLNLVPATGTTDTIEFVGSNGTDISWDGVNNKITVNSTAPVQSDWNATSGLAEILNKPTIPPAYTLPTASSSVLGGIKIGQNLTIDAQGVLSAVQGNYTLPTASTTVLGGVKVDGTSITIDGNGVITANAGSTSPSITTATGTINNATVGYQTLNITSGFKAYVLYKVSVNATCPYCWIRLYTDPNSRDDDRFRGQGTDPSPGSGCIAEVVHFPPSNEDLEILVSPGVLGFNNDDPRTNTIYLAVTNYGAQAPNTTIEVTLTLLKIGE